MQRLFSSFLAILCLSFVSVAVASPHEELIALADKSSGHIQLTPETFALLTTGPRDWSATVHLTAGSPKRRCAPCSAFTPSFNAVAKSWKSVAKTNRDKHFFATLDFDDEGAVKVFQQLQLQSAPAVYVYGKGRGQPSKYDFG